jgi:hypothetical protein
VMRASMIAMAASLALMPLTQTSHSGPGCASSPGSPAHSPSSTRSERSCPDCAARPRT